jgi:hypothetical protein
MAAPGLSVAAAEMYGRMRLGSRVRKIHNIEKVVATASRYDYHFYSEKDCSRSPGNQDGFATHLADL